MVDDAAAVIDSSAGAGLGLGSVGHGATSGGHRNDDGSVKELFMDQRLDHFDRQDSRTFSQRYFINRR